MGLLVDAVAAAILRLSPGTDVGHASAIAADIAAVSDSADDAAALVAIAWHESHFRPDVDSGKVRGDAGRSWGLWQIRCGSSASCSRYVSDRRLGASRALWLVRKSVGACRRYGSSAALRAYASGSCRKGASASAARVDTWRTVSSWLTRPLE